MLDDLRNSAETGYLEEESKLASEMESRVKPKKGAFLGMSAAQRFVIALFIFAMVSIVGIFVLIVFQKITPHF